MKTKFTLTLLLLLLPVMYFMGGRIFAQAYQINTPAAYQPISIVQGGAPDTYKVDIVNNSTTVLSGSTFTVTLPAGMEYVAGTVTGATQSNVSNLQKPVFTVVNIPSGNIQAVTFQARINCGYTQASTISYNLALSESTLASGTSPVASNTPAPAFVLTAVPNPQVLSTQLNTDGNRTIKFKNSGVLPVTTVYVEANVTTDSQISSYKISSVDNGTVSSVIDGQRVILTGTALQNAITTTIGNADASFDPGEEITLVIHEQITNCATGSNISLIFKAGSGDANGSLCFMDTSTASITSVVGNPAISLTRLTGTTWPTFCTNGNVSYIIKNEGSGVASSLYNVKLPWSVNYSNSGLAPNVEPASNIIITKVSINGTDVTNLVLTRNGTGPTALIPGLENGFVINLGGLTSAYGTALQSLDGDGKYDDLLAGQSFQLDFEYAFNISSFKTCLLNSFSTMPNSGWDYFSLGTSYIDQCGKRTSRTNYTAGSITNYAVSSFQVGSQENSSFIASLSATSLNDGDKITLNTSFAGTLSGAYVQSGKIVKTFTIILPDGLDYDPAGNVKWLYGTGYIVPTNAISYNAATRTLALTPESTLTGINNSNDSFEIPLIVNGSETIVNKTVNYSSTLGFKGCEVTMPYGCSSQGLNYAIINNNCSTVGTTSFDMTRTTFGYAPAPSNTNVWYMPTSYVNENTAGINLHGAVSKDKVKTYVKGIVNSTNFKELWARVRYTSNASELSESNFDPLSSVSTDIAGSITITKASDGSTVTGNITVEDIIFSYDSGTGLQMQQVNLGAKIGPGNTIDYTLQTGDQISVNWITKVSRDKLSYTYSELQNLEGDLYTKDSSGITSKCQALPLSFYIQRLYFASNNFFGVQAIVGANGMRLASSIINGSHPTDITGDHFPNEVRSYGVFRNMQATIPGIWVIDKTAGNEPNYSTSYNAANYVLDPSLFSTTYSGGNTIITFSNSALGSNGMPVASANLPVAADWFGTNGNTAVNIFLMSVCAGDGAISPTVAQTYDIYTTEADNSNTETVQQVYNALNYTVYNYKANATPTLQNVDGISSTVNWQVRVTNTSDTAAITAAGGEAELPNNWMSFVSPNTTIKVFF